MLDPRSQNSHYNQTTCVCVCVRVRVNLSTLTAASIYSDAQNLIAEEGGRHYVEFGRAGKEGMDTSSEVSVVAGQYA